MPENDPPKLRVGSVLCRPCWATPALLGTQGQVFLKAGRTMTSQKTCRLGAPRLTIAPWRESQDPTVTFGGLGLVQAQDDKPKCQVFGQR
jgi:hypothetical protein